MCYYLIKIHLKILSFQGKRWKKTAFGKKTFNFNEIVFHKA